MKQRHVRSNAVRKNGENGVPRNQVKRDIIRGGLHEKDTKDKNRNGYPPSPGIRG